jgi:hypothetical protein
MRYYGIRSGINNPTRWAVRSIMSYGGGNWVYYGKEVVDKPWFLEKVDDAYDDTYCDIYTKIKSQVESER